MREWLVAILVRNEYNRSGAASTAGHLTNLQEPIMTKRKGKSAILNLSREKATNKIMWNKMHDMWEKKPMLAICFKLAGLAQKSEEKVTAYSKLLDRVAPEIYTLDLHEDNCLYLTTNAYFCLTNWELLEYIGFEFYQDIDVWNEKLSKEQAELKRNKPEIVIPTAEDVRRIAAISNPFKKKLH